MPRKLSLRHYQLMMYASGDNDVPAITNADNALLDDLLQRGLLHQRGASDVYRLTPAGYEVLKRAWNKVVNVTRKRKRGNPLDSRLPGSFGTGRQ
jgi:hypothetical protein